MERIVILTALEQKERQILTKLLQNPSTIRHPESGTDYYVGLYNNFEIFVGRTDQTNVNAALETERAVTFIKPKFIFFVGVAGGMKDVKVGDVVIGQDVIGYERGKSEAENGTEIFKSRSKFGASSYKLERTATNFSVSEEWSALKSQMNLTNVQVFTGTIASGEQVIASKGSELFNFLKQNCSHALAAEMEGLGFLEACRQYPHVQSLLIRGVSDLIDGKEESDEKGSQEDAMKNAGAFLFGILGSNLLHQAEERLSHFYQDLLEVMCRLYPEGVKMNRVWQRAKGDLSLLVLNTNGFSQWFDAIEWLENGGGGAITTESLLQVVKQDFPHNQFVQLLKSPR